MGVLWRLVENLVHGLTQHLADVRFNVNILKVLKGVSVEQSESGVQSDGHPDTITVPGQLTYLAVLTRVGIKRLLQNKQHTKKTLTAWKC